MEQVIFGKSRRFPQRVGDRGQISVPSRIVVVIGPLSPLVLGVLELARVDSRAEVSVLRFWAVRFRVIDFGEHSDGRVKPVGPDRPVLLDEFRAGLGRK